MQIPSKKRERESYHHDPESWAHDFCLLSNTEQDETPSQECSEDHSGCPVQLGYIIACACMVCRTERAQGFLIRHVFVTSENL